MYSFYRELLKAYEDKKNISEYLKQSRFEHLSEAEIIRFSYDLQAGSYIEEWMNYPERFLPYASEIAGVIKEVSSCSNLINVLDAGAGELTSFSHIMSMLNPSYAFGIDGSFSRLSTGLNWLRSINPDLAKKSTVAVASLNNLPFPPSSLDVVYTCHALEPNQKAAKSVIEELWRVTKHHLFLFEPYYERADAKSRLRMDHYGYVRGLEEKILEVTSRAPKVQKIVKSIEAYNPTYCFHVSKDSCMSTYLGSKADMAKADFIFEETAFDLPINGGLCSTQAKVCLPMINEIPIFDKKYTIFCPKP